MMLSKMISIWESGSGLTNEEIQLLLKNLEPGTKLPLLVDYKCPDNYPKQLIVEIYLNALLKGYKLEFSAWRSIRERGDVTCLKMDERLLRIIVAMSGVVKRRGLDFKFERKFIDFLLLHDNEKEEEDWDHEDCNCIDIGLMDPRLNVFIFYVDRCQRSIYNC